MGASLQPVAAQQSGVQRTLIAFPARLLGARLRVGLTQEDLAQRVGVTQQTIAKWEGGHALPRGEHLSLVAEALGPDFDASSVAPTTSVVSELLLAELIIVIMQNALTLEQTALLQLQLEGAGLTGSDMFRSHERRLVIVAGSAA